MAPGSSGAVRWRRGHRRVPRPHRSEATAHCGRPGAGRAARAAPGHGAVREPRHPAGRSDRARRGPPGGQGDRRPRRLLLRAQRGVRGAAAGARCRGDAAVRRGVRALRSGPPFDHMALRVDLDRAVAGRRRIRAAQHPPAAAVRARRPGRPGGAFRLVDAGGGDLDVLRDGTPQYRVEARGRRLAAYAPTCWWQQTWPSSHFRAGPVASLQTAAAR
jgi:Arylamine N-acetyltransferase